MVRLAALPLLLMLAVLAPAHAAPRRNISIAGLVPPIAFAMHDAETGRTVTAADFRGKVVMLYFGYTNCPDVCPDTLYKVHRIFRQLGPMAKKIVFLFVTVDPKRDGLPVLDKYLALFDPHLTGLRGTPNQLYRLARRYRVVFSVHPSQNPERYTVVHSALIYVFGPHGNARFAIPDLGLDRHPDFAGIAARLNSLLALKPAHGFAGWLAKFG